MTWSKKESETLRALSTPVRIQSFLDGLPYNIDPMARSPRGVLHTRRAHCFDGALLAAAAFEFHGAPPLIMDLRASDDDDDHVLAIYKRGKYYGAVAKSNFTGTRYRDPVFRTLRELALSYFPIYFNLAGVKSLREYSRLFDLSKVRSIDWRYTEEDVDPLGLELDAIKHYPLVAKSQLKYLAVADDRLFRGETIGIDPRGAHKVKNSRL